MIMIEKDKHISIEARHMIMVELKDWGVVNSRKLFGLTKPWMEFCVSYDEGKVLKL